jgi:phosphatidylserine synthase
MTSPKTQQATILSFVRDLPNICSLAGLLCAVLGIYFAVLGNFPAAIIGVIWATLFDWGDGIIARQMKGRTEESRAFGEQLDSLIDIVSFGVLPALILLSYGEFSPLFLPGAFLIIAACTIRLSYFNVFGLNEDSSYIGMAVDNNGIILAFVFLFESILNHTFFSLLIYLIIVAMAVLNVAPIRTPKFTGKWVYVLTAYVLGLTTIYGWMLLRQ